MDTIVGLYDQSNARKAIEVLESYGVDQDQISLVVRVSDISAPQPATYSGPERPGLAGFLGGPGSFSFEAPELGPVIVKGTLALKLFTTLETRTATSLLGALTNEGFSEVQAELYVEGIRRGDILISVESGLQDKSDSKVDESEMIQV